MTDSVEILESLKLNTLALLRSASEGQFVYAVTNLQIGLLHLVAGEMQARLNISHDEAIESSCNWLKLAIQEECSRLGVKRD